MQNYCHPEMRKTEGHILHVEIAKIYCWLGMQLVFVKNWLQPVQLHLLGVVQLVHVCWVAVFTFLRICKTGCSPVAPQKGEKTRPDQTLKHYFILICLNVADEAPKNDLAFHCFCCQLFHSSIAAVLDSLKPYMTVPAVTLCPDGHFHWVIYGLGPYIADYPEQVLLTGLVQGWCPW